MVDGTHHDGAPEDDPLKGLDPKLSSITERFAPGSQGYIADRIAELDAGEDVDPEPDEGEASTAVQRLMAQLEEEGVDIISRSPVAAVVVGRRIGSVSVNRLVVVCSDGACFRLLDPDWTELEPVPGTERAAQFQAEAEKVCGAKRADNPDAFCIKADGHEPPHLDLADFRWE